MMRPEGATSTSPGQPPWEIGMNNPEVERCAPKGHRAISPGQRPGELG